MNNSKVFLLSFLISCATLFCYAKDSTKTLLFFSANWCKYCITAKNDLNSDPSLSEIIKQYDVIVLDFDKDKDIIDGHKIKSIPTFIVFQDGKELKRYNGYRGPSDLIKFLK
jgi:thiol-disulfide isomerase/thioredoxin